MGNGISVERAKNGSINREANRLRMNRQRMLTALQTEHKPWDLIIIGGGATGLGSALEAATVVRELPCWKLTTSPKAPLADRPSSDHGGVCVSAAGPNKHGVPVVA